MASINQNIASNADSGNADALRSSQASAPRADVHTLPSFRNFGSLLRIVLIVNAACLFAALARADTLRAWWSNALDMLTVMQPVLITSLLALAAVDTLLHRMRYLWALATVLGIVWLVTAGVYSLERGAFDDLGSPWRNGVFAAIATLALAAYFDLRNRALSPAVTEARLQALQARIRPHFLFNSINAVLGVIRQNPTQAEHALEDMAELFRATMADQRQMTTLAAEVALCKQYLALEHLRLGDRLQVHWDIAQMPNDARIPPLVLQPLLENAVYHGIEPRSAPGAIDIAVKRDGEYVRVVLRNPFSDKSADKKQHVGNRMALENIRERLQLHFDVEASLKAGVLGDAYEVAIVLPYLKEKS